MTEPVTPSAFGLTAAGVTLFGVHPDDIKDVVGELLLADLAAEASSTSAEPGP